MTPGKGGRLRIWGGNCVHRISASSDQATNAAGAEYSFKQKYSLKNIRWKIFFEEKKYLKSSDKVTYAAGGEHCLKQIFHLPLLFGKNSNETILKAYSFDWHLSPSLSHVWIKGVPDHLLHPLLDGRPCHPVLPDRPHHLCDPRQLLAEAQQISEGAIHTIGGYLTNKFLKSREILSMLIVSVGFLLW